MVGVGCARDIVRAAAAYCTRGDSKFNPKYFPGADLDPSDLCHIGLFDLVVISGKFAKTFGMPSDSVHGWMIPPPMPPGTLITLPQYNHDFKELSKSQGFQYTFAAGVVTVTMGNPADYLVGEYHTSTNMVERFVITIDP